MFNVVAFLCLFGGQYNTFALQDVTVDLFGSENYGTVAAFGDFDADKQSDIFIIRERKLIPGNSSYSNCLLLTFASVF